MWTRPNGERDLARLILALVATVAVESCGHEGRTTKGATEASDLVVPPMPEAGPPSEPAKKPPPEEPKLSYEQALAENSARLNDEPPPSSEPDMTDAQLSAPMRNAAFINACGATDTMKVTVKVAVRHGRAMGVSVYTNPPDEAVARCVDDRVRSLRWPVKQKMDSFTTTY